MPKSLPFSAHHKAESRYRQIIDSARHFAIISTDLDGAVTSWSDGAQHVLGWSEEEMRGVEADIIFTPEDRAGGVPDIERSTALKNGYASDERWHMRKNGERFWAVGEMTPLKDDDGSVVGFVKAMRDRSEQKVAEVRLRDLNEQLENLVAARTHERDRIWRNSLDLLLVIDGQGVLRSVNPAWIANLGYQPEELIDHHFGPFVHPDDIEATFAAVAQALHAPLVHFEVRIRHKDGRYRWFAWTAAPEDDLIYANGRDITVEKQQAEQLLAANETRLRTTLEAGEMGAWEWDMRTDEVQLLHGADMLHGFAATDMPVKLASMQDYLALVHPADRNAVTEVLGQAKAGGKHHRVEYRILRAGGPLQWLEARGTVHAGPDGEPTRMSGVSVNITRRKRVEHDLEFLAQASAELAGLVDPQSTLDKLAFLSVPDFADWCAIDLLREDGTLERVAVAHIDPAKLQLARQLFQRFPPDPDQPHGSWSVIRSGQPQLVSEVNDELIERTVRNPDYGAALRELGLRSYIGVPLIAHGQVMGMVAFISAESGRVYGNDDLKLAADLARRAAVAIENARLYRALQQSDQGKDVFLATLAHELRNPLAAISNGLGVLKLAPHDLSRVQNSTAIMERQVDQLRRLVDDLMDVSRIATGKIALRKEDADLVSIINSAIETTRPMIEASQHELAITLPGEPTRLHGDAVRLAQVFSNLLNNAAKYTNPGGQIAVSLESDSEHFVVRVRDNGIGIPPALLNSIFTIFTQGTHPLERSHGGLGIGLSLVDGLVRLHGGRVEAHSDGENRGSEFVVYLPRHVGTQHAATGVQPDAASAPVRARRILVVDDNADAASTVAELLGILGNEVTVEHDGLSAVATAIRLQPDIVLLDIGLPGIDGYEAARRIRRHQDEHPITLVALTGWGQEQDKERAYQAGFDRHCVKPIDLDTLRDILKS